MRVLDRDQREPDQKVKEGSKDVNFGYNAATDTYEDLVKAGVIDPMKPRSALDMVL